MKEKKYKSYNDYTINDIINYDYSALYPDIFTIHEEILNKEKLKKRSETIKSILNKKPKL